MITDNCLFSSFYIVDIEIMDVDLGCLELAGFPPAQVRGFFFWGGGG